MSIRSGSLFPVVTLILTASMMSCGGKSSTGNGKADPRQSLPPEQVAVLNELDQKLYLDTKLSQDELSSLATDFGNMKEWNFAPYESTTDRVPDAYNTLFGTRQGNALDFIFTRTKAIFSVATADSGLDPRVVAMNRGFVEWLVRVLEHPGNEGEEMMGNHRIRYDSARAGLVTLGKAYTAISSSVYRLTTFVHEARHSDCPEGINDQQIAAIRANPTLQTVKDQMGSCGFMHTKCTLGSTDQYACEDSYRWGAYATEAVYLKAISQACTNCAESEKSEALTYYLESAGRVTDWAKLSRGDYGLPDMRHQGYHKP